MTNREPFLAAIRDYARDEAPRLVYADWLDEHGEPERAEFIRVQCDIAKLPPGVRRKRPRARCPLRRRESRLWRKHNKKWFGETGFSTNMTRFIVRRGFIDEVTTYTVTFLRQAGHLFTQHPITQVDVIGLSPFCVGQNIRFGWSCDVEDGNFRTDWVIREELFIRLPDSDLDFRHFRSAERRRWYKTHERARAALSLAYVNLGREYAGLKPFPRAL